MPETLSIRSSSGKESNCSIQITHLSVAERRAQALRTLGIFWGASLLTLPLPPIHWLTVPGFFIAGIVLSVKKLSQTQVIESCVFGCPQCGDENRTKRRPYQQAMTLYCTKCGYTLNAKIIS